LLCCKLLLQLVNLVLQGSNGGAVTTAGFILAEEAAHAGSSKWLL